jgi:amidase
MTTALWTWSARDITDGIRSRAISCREALTSCLERMRDVNPAVNAVVDIFEDEAFAAAERADGAAKTGSNQLGPLHGVPITVKINVDYAGRATTSGVLAYKDRIANSDNAAIANLRKSGAIIFGRTNVPGFSTRYFTDNPLHGRTLNPWDANTTPGGSSGGAATAVAVGIGPLAHGNDRAGSVRYPAYACGVYGLRPSFGRAPDYNPSNVEERGITSQMTFAHGPLARSVADLRLGLAAMEQGDSRDPWWLPAAEDRGSINAPMRIAVFPTSPGAEVDSAVSDSVRQAGKWLEDAGHIVEELAPPRFKEAAELFWNLIMTEERSASENETASSTRAIEEFGDEAVRRACRGNLKYASPFDFDGYIKGLARRSSILREWRSFLANYPVLIMPNSWKCPFPIDLDQQGDDAVRRMHESLHPTVAVSLLGLPALSVPTGLAAGVPVGVQLVSGRYQDELCLNAGEIIERRSLVKTPISPVWLNTIQPGRPSLTA